MEYPGFLDSELTEEERKRPLFHVLPVPMECSVSYGGGTAAGPRAILDASQQLERWNGSSEPISHGIKTLPPVRCLGSVEQILSAVESSSRQIVASGGIPVALGGEHTVTLGVIRGLGKNRTTPFGVVQIDAHADLRDSYEGSPYSHACVMRRVVEEFHYPLFQFGVRALSREEAEYRHAEGIRFLDGRDIREHDLKNYRLPDDFPQDVYLTIDVDGLDPSIISATGTPVPGGPDWYTTVSFIEGVLDGRRLVGFDCVELAPRSGDHGSDFAAALLIYSVMGCVPVPI